MTYKQYRQYLENHLSKNRYEHTLRVYDTAIELAGLYNADREIVEQAALLHDICKCESDGVLIHKIKQYNIDESLLTFNKELWHGPVGAHFVQDVFQITDETIYNCMYYHTTGREKMTVEELVIFVADYIEPGRNFPGVEEVRELAKIDLKRAAFQALKNTLIFLISKNATLHPNTILAYNDLAK